MVHVQRTSWPGLALALVEPGVSATFADASISCLMSHLFLPFLLLPHPLPPGCYLILCSVGTSKGFRLEVVMEKLQRVQPVRSEISPSPPPEVPKLHPGKQEGGRLAGMVSE